MLSKSIWILMLGVGLALGSGPARGAELEAGTSILEAYPHLKEYTQKESTSPFAFGVGVSPLVMFSNRIGYSAHPFQIHRIGTRLDWEIVGVSMGQSLASGPKATRQFVARTSPKLRLGRVFSIGPLLGMEFISFPEVKARIAQGPIVAPEEPFSSYGSIWGLALAQTFPWKEGLQIRITEVAYRQSYPVTSPTKQDFGYRFSDPLIEDDPKKTVLSPGWVFQFEFSLLF